MLFLKLLNQKRQLSLHEYQSKKLLEEGGINVQRFRIATTSNEAFEAGKNLSICFCLNLCKN
jgi:succinyl-CoA synthetase beta subunit